MEARHENSQLLRVVSLGLFVQFFRLFRRARAEFIAQISNFRIFHLFRRGSCLFSAEFRFLTFRARFVILEFNVFT